MTFSRCTVFQMTYRCDYVVVCRIIPVRLWCFMGFLSSNRQQLSRYQCGLYWSTVLRIVVSYIVSVLKMVVDYIRNQEYKTSCGYNCINVCEGYYFTVKRTAEGINLNIKQLTQFSFAGQYVYKSNMESIKINHLAMQWKKKVFRWMQCTFSNITILLVRACPFRCSFYGLPIGDSVSPYRLINWHMWYTETDLKVLIYGPYYK